MYTPAAHGDRLLDFSNVGYRGKGAQLLPQVATVVTRAPIDGDDTQNIQAAINQVAQMPLVNGFRGAVELSTGHYDIAGQLTISASGIVLRGAGSGTEGSVLHARGTSQRDLIRVLGSGSQSLTGSTFQMIDKVVPAGTNSFFVNTTNGLAVGQTVRVERPGTQAWINAIGMNEVPGGGAAWVPGDFNLRHDRIITRIEGNRVFLDAPLATSFDQQFGGGTMRRYTWSGRIENVGVENIRAESDYNPALKSGNDFIDEDHSWTFVSVDKAQNVWVRDSVARYFAYAAVRAGTESKWVAVDNIANQEPVSVVTGGRRYSFALDGQMGYVTNSSAENGRHDFVNNGASANVGPNVFHSSTAVNARDDTGPHRRWATATLFDNLDIDGDRINARNRGSFGTSHGWSGANMVIFNSTADGYYVQNPPTSQNWLIGSSGPIQNDTRWGTQPAGTYDSHGTRVTLGNTQSLYEAQARDAAEVREFHWVGGNGLWSNADQWDQELTPGVYRISQRDYLAGDIDNYVHDGAGSVDNAFIEPAWATTIVQANGLTVTGFDDVAGNQNVGFTIQSQLDAGERVVHAYLAMPLKGSANGLAANDFVRLFDDNPAHQLTFNQLGWASQVNATTPFVGVLDMGQYLDNLQSGSVNVQVASQTGVDWAMYVASVATPVSDSVGPSVFLDGGGRTILDHAATAVASIRIGGSGNGHLRLNHQALLPVNGDLSQSSNGTLQLDIGGTAIGQFGRLQIAGQAQLGGALQVTLVNGFTPTAGQSFQFLNAAAGVSQTFQQLILPALAPGLQWDVDYGSRSLLLSVVSAAIPGDFNRDGLVDAADYIMWRKTSGQQVTPGSGADGNNDGWVDDGDFNVWRTNVGSGSPGGAGSSSGDNAAPEPGFGAYMGWATGILLIGRRTRRPR